MLFAWALVLREVCIRSGSGMGVVELDGIYTLQDKLLNTDSANFCIEKGLPVGTETPCFRTWQWTYMTSMQSVLIPRPKTPDFHA